MLGVIWERPEPRPAWIDQYWIDSDKRDAFEIVITMGIADIVLKERGQIILKGSDLYGALFKKNAKEFLPSIFYRKRKKAQSVLDLTCGWARDAIRLAQHGIQVIGFEQSAIPYLFSCYAKNFYFPDLDFDLYHGSFHEHSWVYESVWPWVYLDPLFADNRPGLSKKEMELLYQEKFFFSSAPFSVSEQNHLLKDRVQDLKIETLVMKQHRHANAWFDLSGILSVTKYSRVCRFDIYYLNQLRLKEAKKI